MELRDLIVTPLILFIVYGVAYFVRPFVTDSLNRKYFLPGLTVRIIGALAVGFIYQFYYDGGDTFNFHTHGSRQIWNTFWQSPDNGIRLFLNDRSMSGIYSAVKEIPFYFDSQSFNVIRLAFIFDLFTFSSYSATAVLFAVVSFLGSWMFFLAFYERFPQLHRKLAFAAFFIPSVFFWGSGLLKDTITTACLGIAVYQVQRIFIAKRIGIRRVLLLIVALYGMYSIKIYILLNFLPVAILWIFFSNFNQIKSSMAKAILLPFVLSVSVFLGYWSMVKVGEDNERYKLANIGKTARITAYDIRYYSGRDAGSGYSLGELDGSIVSMLALAPQAINVSLFRPFLWEVNNPLMLLSALEALAVLLITGYVLVVSKFRVLRFMTDPTVMFCLVFSLSFAFAVGVSTFNFGTLARYKIPLLPFYLVAMILIHHFSKRDRKVAVFD